MVTAAQPNISQLTEKLWTGGDLPVRLSDAALVVEAWCQLGIGCVIDNRLEWDDTSLVAAVAPDIAYLHAGVDDAGQTMPDWWFDCVTEFALDGLRRESGVLVHCHMGINRGPSAAFAVLLATGWDPVTAIDHIRSVRPIAAVGYAEDALDWWQRRADTSTSERHVQRSRLRGWRREHPHDTVRIIREIRVGEQ